MSTAMAEDRKVRDVSVLKIAADMIEEAGWTDEAANLRRWAQSAEKGLPQSIEVRGKRWFQRSYGNTYFSARIWVNGELVHELPKEYGYESAYFDAAWDWLGKNDYLGATWQDEDGRRVTPWQWASENGVQLDYSAEDVKRERDL